LFLEKKIVPKTVLLTKEWMSINYGMYNIIVYSVPNKLPYLLHFFYRQNDF